MSVYSSLPCKPYLAELIYFLLVLSISQHFINANVILIYLLSALSCYEFYRLHVRCCLEVYTDFEPFYSGAYTHTALFGYFMLILHVFDAEYKVMKCLT